MASHKAYDEVSNVVKQTDGNDQVVQSYAYVNNDPTGEDINCLGSTCSFTYNGIVTTPFPRPDGFPDTINSDSSFHHLYNAEYSVTNSHLTMGQINAGIASVPTPGPSNVSATAEGVYNNASPGGLLSMGHDAWPVTSYIVNDVASGAPITLNVTLPDHPLFPGVVARYVTGVPGNYSVQNVGEGTAGIESNWNLLAEYFYDGAWNDLNDSMFSGFGGAGISAGALGSSYASSINTNQIQSVYDK